MNEHITNYYVDQASGIFHGPMIQNGYGQKGAGVGRLLKKFMTWITPLAKKHVLPSITSGVKSVSNQIVNSLADFAKDTISGKNYKEAASDRYEEAVNNLKQQAEQKFEGNGIKRKRSSTINKAKKFKKYVILKNNKKSRVKDIFDN